MTAQHELRFGPRLIATATGKLRAAVLLKPSASIERATPLNAEPGAVYERAIEQHDTFRKTLEYFGAETVVLEARGDDPYEAAVGDAAVAFGDGAALMRLTQMSRRGEVDRMESNFASLDVPLAGHIEPPGLLDGNDVVLAGETAFVGIGARGNDLGRDGFAQLARSHGYRVVPVTLAPGVPALRAVLSAVSKDTVVVGGDKVDRTALEGFRTIVLERGEEQGAGVFCLGDRHVLADIRYRTALQAMRQAGIAVEAIDLYEFTKLGLTPSMLALALRRE